MQINRESFVWKIPSKEFRLAISECNTWNEIARRYYASPSTLQEIKNRAYAEKIDISHLKGKISTKSHPKYSIHDLLSNKHFIGNQRLKKRLLQENLIEDRCYFCGLDPVWNGTPLTLRLTHLNGNKRDNSLNNILLLCPNCYSQTSSTKNIAGGTLPPSDILAIQVTFIGYSGVAKKYNTTEQRIKSVLFSVS